jgi:hypothetical protein
MAEQCHHWVNGIRCTKRAVNKAIIRQNRQEVWKCYVCGEHSKFYAAQGYPMEGM